MNLDIMIFLSVLMLFIGVVAIWNIFQDKKLHKIKDYFLKGKEIKILDDNKEIVTLKRGVIECNNCKVLEKKLNDIKEVMGITEEKEEKEEIKEKKEKKEKKKDEKEDKGAVKDGRKNPVLW